MIKHIAYLVLFLFAVVIPNSVNADQLTIVSFGDSTTAPRGPLRVYSQVLSEELQVDGQNVKVINSGIGGNNTKQAVKRFQKDVLNHKPNYVIIQFGINDAAVDVHKTPPATKSRVSQKEYKKNLLVLVSTLKSRNIKTILMTPNPCTWTENLIKYYGKPPYDHKDPDGFNLFLREYAQTVREISKSEDIPLIDIYKIFQDYGKNDGKSMSDLLLDGMHPNKQGQKMVADLLMKMILKLETNKN